MNAESIVALIALVVTLPVSIIAIILSARANKAASRSATASERAAETAEEQTAIQRSLSRRSAEPSLWVDMRADDASGQMLTLVVGNSGPTIATRVVVTFDPPLRDFTFETEAVHRGEERLNAGLASLPPGRILSWSMGAAGRLISNPSAPKSYDVTINALGPFGQIEPLSYTIDLDDMRHNRIHSVTPGTLFGISQAVGDLGKSLKEIAMKTGSQ